MMGSCGQTIVKYQGVALPVNPTGVTLFDSIVAFPAPKTPAGGSFHLLGLQWFQFALRFTAAGGGTVTGNFSDDGLNWQPFYTGTTAVGTITTIADEVYVGIYRDVQFVFVPAANTSTFSANLALNPHKPTSKHAAADRLVNAVTFP